MSISSVVLCGHHKCGTTWLADVIGSSPSFDLIHTRNVAGHVRENADQIRERIATSNKTVFIHYMYSIPDIEALVVLKGIDPNMGAIIIYRDPVDAMESMHNYQRWRYKSKRLVGYARDVVVPKHIHDRDFMDSVKSGVLQQQFERLFRYDKNAQNLRKYFSQFLELNYNDLKRDPKEFVEKIFSFAGAEPDYKLPEGRINKSISVRSWFIDRIISKSFLMLTGLNSRALYGPYRDGRLKYSLYRTLLDLNTRSSYFLDDAQRAELKEFYCPIVKRFAEITSIDISDWGYEFSADIEGEHTEK